MYFDLTIPSQLAGALLPDLILVIGAMLLLLVAVWGPETPSRARLIGLLTIAVCAGAFAAVVWIWNHDATASAGLIAVDPFRWATDCIILAATIIAATLMIDYGEREQLVSTEVYVLLLLAASGMMLLAAARDLMVVFLGIELMSIASYVLAGIDRRSARGAEAALKYFLLGAFSTGFLLYG
ncbi:MAG: proton-conducting transporter membrane subunit, partial [Gemmatimonadaceae bacterium]